MPSNKSLKSFLIISFFAFLLIHPAFGADDYPYSTKCTAEHSSCVDPWDFYYRQCTSYVAWRMNRDAQTMSSPYSFYNKMLARNPTGPNRWTHAYHWDEHAKALGITVNSEPVVGAIAQWNENEIGGGYGHVAYVEKVYADGSIDISEYNINELAYGTRKIKPVLGKGPRFIHINASDKTVFNFTDNTSEGWTAGNAILNPSFENGKWFFNTGVDPYVNSPHLANGITADQFRKVEVSLSAKGNERTENACIYFDTGSGFNDTEKFHLGEVPTQGQSQLYIVDFPTDTIADNSPLQQIRLDPLYSEGLNYTPNDTVEIDFIRLISNYDLWNFQDTPLGWSLKNAFSEGYIDSWAWKIHPSTGDPQLISPWLGNVNNTDYESLYLRFAVNCAAPFTHAVDDDGIAPFSPPSGNNAGVDVCYDQDSGNVIKLNGNVYFDLTDDQAGFNAQSPTVNFEVKPTGAQEDYIIQLPSTDYCAKVHQIRVDFFEDYADKHHLVYLDKVEFQSGNKVVQMQPKVPEIQFFTSASSEVQTGFITILQINELIVTDNTPVVIQASAFGCCSEEYNWSLPVNPLGFTIDNQGNISGNSGSIGGIYTTTVRVEDKYASGNFTEQNFTVTVTTAPDSNSIRIYNDGTASLQITGISKENNSSWLMIDVPSTLPSVEPGKYYDIFISVKRQGLAVGNYYENILITSNDDNNTQILVPVSLNVDTDSSAPFAPQNVSASPWSWFSNGTVTINWENPLPEDPSGIGGVYYKIGSPPSTNSDGIFETNKPLIITPTSEGEQTVYLWLVDGSGNADYQKMNSVVFFFDNTAPSIVSKYPDNSESEIPVDSSIFINLEDVYSGLDIATITMTVNGSAVTPVVTGSPNNYSLSYKSAVPFGYGESVSVSIEASDFSSFGNTMNSMSWFFSTVEQESAPGINNFYLNEDDESTTSSIVLLSNSTFGNPTEYIASELIAFSDAVWQPYSAFPFFTLSSDNGHKTVYLKVRNSAGESSVLADTISLEDTASLDNCPDDPFKTEPGICGCSHSDIDTDADGTADCNDVCFDDPYKVIPGICGCGISDIDSDGDNIADCNDNCLTIPNTTQEDTDGDNIGDACEGGDNDGISANIDGRWQDGVFIDESGHYSNNFTDTQAGGATYGLIIERGDLNMLIVDANESSEGVQINSNGALTTSAGMLKICDHNIELSLEDSLIATCSPLVQAKTRAIMGGVKDSFSIKAITGEVKIFLDKDEYVVVPAEGEVEITETSKGTFEIKNNSINATITVLTDKKEILLKPAQQITVKTYTFPWNLFLVPISAAAAK